MKLWIQITKNKFIQNFFKRFGLQKCDYEKTDKSLLNKNYKDRAGERRDKVGVDFSHIPKAAKTDALSKENIGFSMLAKMGWKEGIWW